MQTAIIVSTIIKKETEQFDPFSAFFGSFFVFSAQQFWTAVGLSLGSINNDSKHICTMRVYSSASSSLESLPAP